MKYQQPCDQPANPDASYVTGDPRIGRRGSIPPGAAFEHPQREIVNFISKNSLTPIDTDLYQLCRSLQNSTVSYGLDTGTANDMVVALDPEPSELVPGLTLRVKKSALANTDLVTLNIGLGADPVVKATGAQFNAGDLQANMVMDMVWDGAQWQVLNYLGVQSSTETVNNYYAYDIPYCVDTGTADHIVAPYNPAITSLASGDLVSVKLANQFSGGPADITINALAPISVKRGDTVDPIFGDGVVGQIILLEYDGTVFQIVNTVVPGSPLPVVLADEKPIGTHCGTFTHGDWRTRDLNVIIDPFGLVAAGIISLANNRITLAPGKWILHARAPAINVGHHQCRWWSHTHNHCHGKGHFCWHYYHDDHDWDYHHHHSWSFMDVLLNVTEPTTYELQHRCQRSCATWGFGRHGDDFWHDDDALVERYAVVYLTKVS